MSYLKLALPIMIALIAIFTVLGCWYTIDQGDIGVVLTNGAISEDTGPGLHFKFPWVQRVVEISTQTQRDAFEYSASNDERMEGYTKDQQSSWVALSINYHVTNPDQVYARFGSVKAMEDRVIDPRANEQVRNILGQFSAQQVIDDRAHFNGLVLQAIMKAIDGPIVVESVQVEDIKFSKAFETSVEARMQAIVRQQQAEAEKQKTMIDADANKYKVEAEADATKYAGLAEAAALSAKADALSKNGNLATLNAIDKWDGTLPTQMVPGSALPFLNLGGK